MFIGLWASLTASVDVRYSYKLLRWRNCADSSALSIDVAFSVSG